jgi:hypothetical protein
VPAIDVVNIYGNFGNVLWVAFSIPSGSLSLVKYPVYFRINNFIKNKEDKK